MQLAAWGAPRPVKISDAEPGTTFVTAGPDAALYVALSGNLALRLAAKGSSEMDLKLVSRGELHGADAFEVDDPLFLRVGGPHTPWDLFMDIGHRPDHGSLLMDASGAVTHLVVEGEDAIDAVDTRSWRLIPLEEVARKGGRWATTWTLWRTYEPGRTDGDDEIGAKHSPIATFKPRFVVHLPEGMSLGLRDD